MAVNPDPWSEIESLAAEGQIDLAPARMLVEQAQSTLIIDPELAIGNTILDYLKAGRSLDEAVAVARQQLTAALEPPGTGGPEVVE
jgi:hypothetical protein